ncbi:MAG: hypothetical protein KDD51_12745 [Bdellovibrionales bacterium]|nr:hypothetical protein [Bdellovibrionales bacterium]
MTQMQEHFERTSYQRQLRLLVSVFLVCAVLSFSGCRGKNLQFFGQNNDLTRLGDNNLSSNQGRGSGSDSLTSLPNDPQLTGSTGLALSGLGGNFAPAQNFLMAPFGIRSMAALNTIPRTNLVNAAVGGLVDVVTNTYFNKSYVEYIARFGGGSTDNEWVSARLYLIPPGFENSESFITFDEGPGMYAAIVTKTTARGIQARGKELIASYGDIQNAAVTGFDPKVFLELAVYDMEALLYVNGKLATSGHQCDRSDRGEFGIGGTNGGTIYTMDAMPFNSAPRVFQDYFNQSTANSQIYLNEDWQAQLGFFNRMPLGSGAVAVPIPNTRSVMTVPNLQMLYFDVSADVDVRNPLNKSVVSAGVVGKYGPQGQHYIGRLKNQDGVVKAQILKQLADGSRHNLTEIAVPGNFPLGRIRFTITYEQARGQVLRVYFRPVGAGIEQQLLDTVHNGIDTVGSAGLEAQDGVIDNFEVRVGDDDRRIENF